MPNQSARDIKSVLAQVLEHHNLETQIQDINIMQNWSGIVGVSLAKQCEPVSIENEILYIKVKNSIWMSELVKRQNELVDLINDKIASQRIKMIKII
jgi:predicted nucleic acid-binding Zn ribbon protein